MESVPTANKKTMSKIQWTERTWNPIRGCSRISPGCQNCYAERMAARNLPGMKSPTTGEPFAIMKPSGPHWTGKLELIPHMLDIPLRTRKPTTWFVNSMSDLFHEALPDEAIDRVFAVMALCPQHVFQVLTKRADRMREYMGKPMLMARRGFWASHAIHQRDGGEASRAATIAEFNQPQFPLTNVWLGCSVENRQRKSRIDELRETPAAVRFLSLEPLLEDLGAVDLSGIHWAIVGGESGPGARPMNIAWARSLVEQCGAAGVACFVKQLGSNPRSEIGPMGWPLKDKKGGDMAEWPADLQVRKMPSMAQPQDSGARTTALREED